jgi:hypothetical protein
MKKLILSTVLVLLSSFATSILGSDWAKSRPTPASMTRSALRLQRDRNEDRRERRRRRRRRRDRREDWRQRRRNRRRRDRREDRRER